MIPLKPDACSHCGEALTGSRFVERMLTASETCRLQNRPLFDYLTQAVTAHFAKQPAPSLTPEA